MLLQVNTFEAVIASNGSRTYAILQYLDNGINWFQCDSEFAQAGITGLGTVVGPPTSGTAGIADIETDSNVGVPGKYVYGIHEINITEPEGE